MHDEGLLKKAYLISFFFASSTLGVVITLGISYILRRLFAELALLYFLSESTLGC